MTKKELQAQAKAQGIKFSAKTTKAELQALLAEAQAPAQAEALAEELAEALAEAIPEAESQYKAEALAEAIPEALAEAFAEAQAEAEAEALAKADAEAEASVAQAQAQAQAQARAEAEAEADADAEAEADAKCDYLVNSGKKGFALYFSKTVLEEYITLDGTCYRLVDKPCKKPVAIAKQVFSDCKRQYAESVSYYYFEALEAISQAQAKALNEVDTSDFTVEAEKVHDLKIKACEYNISNYSYLASLFAEAEADALAKAQGLYMAGAVLPITTGQLITDLSDLHTAFKAFNLEGLKTGKASYTTIQVDNMNLFRADMRAKLEPFTGKTALHHQVKVSISNEDMFSWLCWSQGKSQKFDFDGKSGKVRFDKALIQFLMFKAKTAPKK